jgi:hypothetical protein
MSESSVKRLLGEPTEIETKPFSDQFTPPRSCQTDVTHALVYVAPDPRQDSAKVQQ